MMQALPTELLSEIVTRCERETVFRLRGVSKCFNGVVTSIAFENIYVGWRKQHFEALEHLANSPVATHIRCLTINTEILPMLDGYAWLEQLRISMIKSRGFRKIPDHWNEDDLDEIALWQIITTTYSKDRVKANREKFVKLALEQQQDSAHMCRILINAMSALGNLQCLELMDYRGVYKRGKNRKERSTGLLAECSPWRDMLIDPDSYYGTMANEWEARDKPPGPENVSSAFALHYLAKSLALGQSRKPTGGWSSVQEIVFVPGHHIPVANLNGRTLCQPCELGGHGCISAGSWDMAYLMSSTLTRVNVQMVAYPLDDNRAVCRELVKGLECASNLRHLEINDRQVGSGDLFDAITTMKPERPWPLLEHLSVSGDSITTEELSKLIAMWATTLRVLEIQDISLTWPGATDCYRWDKFFESIKPNLKLRKAIIRHLCYCPEEWKGAFFLKSGRKSAMNVAVEDFLVGKIEKLPRQEEWDFTPGPLGPFIF